MPAESTGSTASNAPLSPLWVGIAIALLPPLGIYLLWKHPVLGQSGAWRKAAYAWCAVWCIAQVSNAFTGDHKKTAGSDTRSSKRGGNARPPSREQVEAARAKPQIAAPPSGKSAAYRRGWQEAYEGGKRWGEINRSAASSQLDIPMVAALRSTLSSLEKIPVELRSEGWKEAYDLEKGRLEGFLAGLNE